MFLSLFLTKPQLPEAFIPAVLAKVKPEYVARTYGIMQWTDAEDFLTKLAEKTGRLLKKGEVCCLTPSPLSLSPLSLSFPLSLPFSHHHLPLHISHSTSSLLVILFSS
jgi:hypothetical protein